MNVEVNVSQAAVEFSRKNKNHDENTNQVKHEVQVVFCFIFLVLLYYFVNFCPKGTFLRFFFLQNS